MTLLLSLGCVPAGEKVDPAGPATDSSDTEGPSDTACTPTAWYIDGDGDGFGDPASEVDACPRPAGVVADGTDCDDGDPQVYPGAAELCRDGVVNDCDAEGDAAAVAFCSGSGPFSLDGADGTIAGSTEDHAGWRVSGAGDLNGDGLDDLMIGAAYGDSIGVAEVMSPVAGTMSLGDADGNVYAEAEFGGLVTGLDAAGDVDGDGLGDIVIGDPGASRAYLVLSPVTGDMSAGESDTVFTREETGVGGDSRLGDAVAGLGDTDGDGLSDLLLGAPDAQGLTVDSERGACASEGADVDEYGPGVWAGVAYLYSSAPAGTVDANDADARLFGEDAGDYAGADLAGPGDMNGDGLADLALTAQGNCEGGAFAGAVYLVEGPVVGDLYLGDADGKIVGTWSRPYFDTDLSSAGDTNGDGTPDLLSWSPLDSLSSENGIVYLFLGPVSGAVSAASEIAAIDGTEEWRADSIAAAGDLDTDGYDDILIGGQWTKETHWTEDWTASAAIFHGPLSGTISLDVADQTFVGAAGSAYSVQVAGVGDADADGLPDALVGTPYADTAGTLSGAAWLLLSDGALLSGDGEL